MDELQQVLSQLDDLHKLHEAACLYLDAAQKAIGDLEDRVDYLEDQISYLKANNRRLKEDVEELKRQHEDACQERDAQEFRDAIYRYR